MIPQECRLNTQWPQRHQGSMAAMCVLWWELPPGLFLGNFVNSLEIPDVLNRWLNVENVVSCWTGNLTRLTHWYLGKVIMILDIYFFQHISMMKIQSSSTEMYLDVFMRILLAGNLHWFRWWLGAVWQQAITWTNAEWWICMLLKKPFNE